MSEQLNKLREIVSSTKAPPIETRPDPRDAVGKAAIDRSEIWLKENKNLSGMAKYSKWKEEVRAGARINEFNKDYFWETEAGLHPKGRKFAEEDKLNIINERLSVLDDAGKEAYLQDIAREAPPTILNSLLTSKTAVSRKRAAQTQERARIANILDFGDNIRNFSNSIFKGEMSVLNPEVSISSHAEDWVKAWSANRTDIFTDPETGRISITSEEGQVVPVYALENSALTWEEEAINAHDLFPVAKRALKSSLEYSRSNERNTHRATTLALAEKVEEMPREFQASIIVDGAELSPNPIGELTKSIYKTVEHKMERNEYMSLKDITRDYMTRWEDVGKVLEARVTDGMLSQERMKNV